VSHSSRLNIYGPPVVRTFPEKIKAVEGKLFMLKCPVAGFPIQEVKWKKGEKHNISDHCPKCHLFFQLFWSKKRAENG